MGGSLEGEAPFGRERHLVAGPHEVEEQDPGRPRRLDRATRYDAPCAGVSPLVSCTPRARRRIILARCAGLPAIGAEWAASGPPAGVTRASAGSPAPRSVGATTRTHHALGRRR